MTAFDKLDTLSYQFPQCSMQISEGLESRNLGLIASMYLSFPTAIWNIIYSLAWDMVYWTRLNQIDSKKGIIFRIWWSMMKNL